MKDFLLTTTSLEWIGYTTIVLLVVIILMLVSIIGGITEIWEEVYGTRPQEEKDILQGKRDVFGNILKPKE